MRIIYVAKHDSGGNDDEGAITFALERLGHEVVRVPERLGFKVAQYPDKYDGDLLLFHKWSELETLIKVRHRMPRVFWYFDLVDFPDPALAGRNRARVEWMRSVIPHVELGFCTDGDWVATDGDPKLVQLSQGADERFVGAGNAFEAAPPLLFTGQAVRCGHQRGSFVNWAVMNWKKDFNHVTKGVHGRKLANLIAESKIVLAPDGPVTDRYWSNRVYLTCGFGGFLLHPRCRGLEEHYQDGQEIVFYGDRFDLFNKIKHFLDRPAVRGRIAAAGLERTLRQHLYRHRCAELLRTVKERT